MRPSQKLLLPPRIYPLFSTNVYVRPSQKLPLPPSQTIPHFSTAICDPPRIYPSLLEDTPLFNKFICATLPKSSPPAQNTPPPFSPTKFDPPTTIILYDAPRIYPSLPEYTLHSQQLCATLPESIPLYPRIYTIFQQLYICDPPRSYPSLPEYTPPLHQLYVSLPESTLPS